MIKVVWGMSPFPFYGLGVGYGCILRGQHQTEWTPQPEPEWILVRMLERMEEAHLQGGEAVVYAAMLTSRALENRRVGCSVRL
jgi:hypothetical protein